MARHSKQPNGGNHQESSLRQPRTVSGNATAKTNGFSTPASFNKTREASPRTLFYQTNSNDPFQIAIAQGIHDGNKRIDRHTKDILRRVIISIAAIAIVCVAVFGVMVRTSQKMHELHELNTCKNAVTSMNASYSKAFQLKGKVVDAFSSMDSSYDLEKLSTLYKEEVKAPKSLDCKVDPSGTVNKAKTEKATYDKQAKAFKAALKKIDAGQNVE